MPGCLELRPGRLGTQFSHSRHLSSGHRKAYTYIEGVLPGLAQPVFGEHEQARQTYPNVLSARGSKLGRTRSAVCDFFGQL